VKGEPVVGRQGWERQQRVEFTESIWKF
jgi:hypothetical protein